MPYLMEISFDNDHRFARKTYLFEYRGYQFKLHQENPRRWADSLLTILEDGTDQRCEDAFQVASEFLSALAWSIRSRIAVWECGGRSWQDIWKLSKAQPSAKTFPRIPFHGNVSGSKLVWIPKITSEEQRIALALFREANASNNDYLSFLFFWQIFDIGSTNAEGIIEKIRRRKPREVVMIQREVDKLPLRNHSNKLGKYLREEGRDAIAHIKRKPNKKKLELDNIAARAELSTAVRVVKTYAAYYIENNLGLQDRLWLKRKGRNGFPIFNHENATLSGNWQLAYK